MNRPYQIMGSILTLGTVMAPSFNDALVRWARERGYPSWETYRDAMGIERVSFDGGGRITLH